MSTFGNEFSVSLDDSVAFARLSGDYNPLHVDPITARRSRFGGTVTHGIHLLLRALDELAAQKLFDQQQPEVLFASFHSPVLTGAIVTLRGSIEGNKARFAAEVAGRAAFSGTIEFAAGVAAGVATEAPIANSEFGVASPQEVDFPPSISEGSVPLKRSHSLCLQLFPSLSSLAGGSWIADLLATTQIIGMRCPGMHSIYSTLRLRRARQPGSGDSMHYRVAQMEERLQMVRIEVTGAYLAGTIDASFRPRPVAQRAMKDLVTVVPSGAFGDHRVLAVGGSRGLGELTAKIAAAGGADVTITHAHGRADADRICDEVRALGFRCTARQLDVTGLAGQAAPEWLSSSRFSHVYFFASPLIAKNTGRWSDALFQQFTQMYVAAFAALVERTCAPRRSQGPIVRFLYPSSIFVDQPEAGFSEYAVAKAAGEALCDQLQSRRAVQFLKPRLPRMRTDQTSALVDIGALDPVPVMLDVVKRMHLEV